MQDLPELFHLRADLTYAWEYWIDPHGQFRYASPSCAQSAGYGPGEFVADPDLVLRITHPYDREMLKADQQHCDAGTERSLDFRIIAKEYRCWAISN